MSKLAIPAIFAIMLGNTTLVSAASDDKTWSLVEPPENYKVTTSNTLDNQFWEIALLVDENNVRIITASTGRDRSSVERTDYWIINGETGSETTDGDDYVDDFLFRSYSIEHPISLLWPYQSSMPERLLASNNPEVRAAMESARQELLEELVPGVQVDYKEQDAAPCGNKTCRVFRFELTAEQINDPGWRDFYVDPVTGYVQKLVKHSYAIPNLPEWTQTSLFEYNVDESLEELGQ